MIRTPTPPAPRLAATETTALTHESPGFRCIPGNNAALILPNAKLTDTERAVRTASSEQVRQPIYREGVDHWRHYEPWLQPLKQALGPALAAYPA